MRPRRTHRPFVSLNVAAIPKAVLEAEFFGVAPWPRATTSAQVVMGLIFIFCVRLFRRGIVGKIQLILKRNMNL